MVSLEIEKLLLFALDKGLIEKDDIILTRNLLLDLLRLSVPCQANPENYIVPDTATNIINTITEYAIKAKLTSVIDYELFEAKLMGLLVPRQSEINRTFQKKYSVSPKDATDWFYGLSRSSNYIQTAKIAKNLYWLSETDFGQLEITVNLSKPEKDPKEIAKAKNVPQTGYPKCLLCTENIGFAGNINHPARQNHRTIAFDMQDHKWHLQYSPYVYYNEHCIVLHNEHVPMKLGKQSFCDLIEFTKGFPHYFIGSNADLPIVGGSILTHNHYQGGRHVFPMETAKIYANYKSKQFPNTSIGIVSWPMTTIRLAGEHPDEIIQIADLIYTNWKNYSDIDNDISAFSGEVPHNTVTPIARRRKNISSELIEIDLSRSDLNKNNLKEIDLSKNDLYEMDIVLRNNRTSDEHPFGIFHPHCDVHHIKKENIGLIEVMGLAVLPGRLNDELEIISQILCGDDARRNTDSMKNHASWIMYLIQKYGNALSKPDADKIIRHEVGVKFARVLSDAGVYKLNENGKTGINKFMLHCGFAKIV